MNQTKIELLAPAGDFACFQSALNAGADAVYLGGDKFGARAYAHNFSEEEIIEALRIAHLFQKKIYLTVNTLVKEKEIADLIPYLTPLYEAGLDGVIVQDIGALMMMREHFPGLELHASTQMTITGVYGAEFLKQLGVCRVVPARELSLDEIRDIKDKTGLAIETFIHGAMCYAYSGQCLFSSILGGRSGNRGRCAGPCRLPYTDEQGHVIYPLSLKDMYTLPIIPKLIQAGIDSFKIEGRMKSPEYVAGVTAMYRKYIDAYLQNPDKPYHVSPKDEAALRGLYIRTDICQGYYEQHNGRNMVTMKEAGYLGSDDSVLNDIRNRYLNMKKTIAIHGNISVFTGQPIQLTLTCDSLKNKEGQLLCVTEEGSEAGEAINRPLTKEDISNRICKLGDTNFAMSRLEVLTDGQSFVPVKVLNELRRQACLQLENAILALNENRHTEKNKADLEQPVKIQDKLACHADKQQLYVQVTTLEQLRTTICSSVVRGIYVNIDLAANPTYQDAVMRIVKEHSDIKFFLALPHILRKRSYHMLDSYNRLTESKTFSGVLIRNLEELQWLVNIDYKGQIIADYTLYAWNQQTIAFYQKYFDRHTMPLELNRKELLQLQKDTDMSVYEICIYGRLPLMFSANCAKKTLTSCNPKSSEPVHLTDRYRNDFPVVQNCTHCYNVLYNTVPMSLHNQFDRLYAEQYGVYRLDFTLEDEKETARILEYYEQIYSGEKNMEFPCADYTNGHYKRGVE